MNKKIYIEWIILMKLTQTYKHFAQITYTLLFFNFDNFHFGTNLAENSLKKF
jgi:hypothetical protein